MEISDVNKIDELKKEVFRLLNEVTLQPQERIKLREKFYKKYGFLNEFGNNGYGSSEIAFMKWEIKRGVLTPHIGSLWWNSVNLDFIYLSEFAGLIEENGLREKTQKNPEILKEPKNSTTAILFWLKYFQKPSAKSWYKAHNSSIITGYVNRIQEAKQENHYEQVFINMVLYRVLFAQSMVEDKSLFEELGEILANPILPAVDVMVHIPDFYPIFYPLDKKDFDYVIGNGHNVESMAVNILDNTIIIPHLKKLYAYAAEINNIKELTDFIQEGKPIYPVISENAETEKKKDDMLGRKKIVILGGGLASLTSAYELTKEKNWQSKYDITIYQVGWRLGGKMAGGRGVNNRIQTVGLHLLLGWCNNVYRLFREVYEERKDKNLAPESKYQTLESILVKNNATPLMEYLDWKRSWENWPLVFPQNDAIPGEGQCCQVKKKREMFDNRGA